ncbi:DUF2975 domain-containing protein [Pseudarthrobacter phenanthrenivorans]|uniref:DUF2975 domain-containing protein n=1 Tax=Pseudarthrobacter phenanthrenivorans TaxID=361575 RepID=UPI00112C1D00|nr:DUF2975 domain-containing protein [Pseudarthrobacter phenanthrenivorans]TPV52635.1 DUF2975 domain-containing protein [Pseudarthrobacter phenanthrenivorans]
MSIVSRLVLPLRVLLVMVFLGLLVAQVMSFPGEFLFTTEEGPGMDPWRWPLLLFFEFEALCLQVVIVCIWRLLTLIQRDRIFSTASLRWVDAIVWAFVAAWLLLAVMAGSFIAYLYFTPELRDPGTPALLIGITLIGAVLVLLIVVMRDLLRQATSLRADMDGVI